MENKVKVIIKWIICAFVGTVLGLGLVKSVRAVVEKRQEEI